MKLVETSLPLVLTAALVSCAPPTEPGGEDERTGEVTQADGSYSSCQALVNAGVITAGVDVEHAITVNGNTMSVYCHFVSGTPFEYLTLPRTGSGRNTSRWGNQLTTAFTRLRFHPDTLTVDTTDTTFSTSSGSYVIGGTTVTTMSYGEAGDCAGNNSDTGVGNVDLSGTPFAVAPDQFATGGWYPAGGFVYSGREQIVDLTGGGYCGGTGVVSSSLQLQFIGTGAYPASCAAAKANGSTTDGEYLLSVSGQPLSVYCSGMASTPREYLTLKRTGAGYNYSQATAGGAFAGTNVVTSYTKVRFDPRTLQVDTTDRTFATSTGNIPNYNISSMSYAGAADCAGNNSQTGKGDVDLSGTGLAVVSGQFAASGWYPAGSATYSPSSEAVTLTGGGYCGGEGPTTSQLLLELSVTGTCAELRAKNPSAQDGPYTLYANHDMNYPWTAYCQGMATGSPVEYLPLQNTGGSANYSEAAAGGAFSGTNVVTSYTKVRIDPGTFQVDITDRTFATSTGNIGNYNISSVNYASAISCVTDWDPAGSANVDLTGTEFSVPPGAFVAGGWHATGSAAYSNRNQVVNLTGGGYCGGEGPSGDGVHLPLVFSGSFQPAGSQQTYTQTGGPNDPNSPRDRICQTGTYVVPAGVTWVEVTAIGGSGTSGDSPGGLGAMVDAYIPVTPGQTLYVMAASSGGSGGDGYGWGFPGAGTGPAPGGGASYVSTVAPTKSVDENGGVTCNVPPQNLLIIAGGGGGGGTNGGSGTGGNGGNGGLLGQGGGDGQGGGGWEGNAGGGGGGGQLSGGGSKGSHPGCGSEDRWPGAYLRGGDDTRSSGNGGDGGSGGAGYYGGGAGGGGDCALGTGGGGGGGGSSWVVSNAFLPRSALDRTGSPGVVIAPVTKIR